jgi:hypothetical protein
MAYALEAFVMGSTTADEVIKPFSSALAVSLARGLSLIPLTGDFLAKLESIYHYAVSFKFEDLPTLAPSAVEWAEQVSLLGPVAFVEAEFFGGMGDQAGIGWQDGSVVFGPVRAAAASNQVLRWLGVVPGDQSDEFDALQLGRYRNTEEWGRR